MLPVSEQDNEKSKRGINTRDSRFAFSCQWTLNYVKIWVSYWLKKIKGDKQTNTETKLQLHHFHIMFSNNSHRNLNWVAYACLTMARTRFKYLKKDKSNNSFNYPESSWNIWLKQVLTKSKLWQWYDTFITKIVLTKLCSQFPQIVDFERKAISLNSFVHWETILMKGSWVIHLSAQSANTGEQ